jgi:non-ribosomal peptide synthetase component F
LIVVFNLNCLLAGRPKGVQVSHTALADYLAFYQQHYHTSVTDVGLMSLSINFDAHLLQLLPPLTAGGQLVLAAPGRHLDYEYMVQLMHNQHVSLFTTPSSLLGEYLSAMHSAGLACSSLRSVTVGGDSLQLQLVEQFYSLLPNAQLHNEYGPTESTIGVTVMLPGSCSSSERQQITIGRPHSNVHCYVVDSQLQLVPPGVPGELLLSGPRLAVGYIGQPGLTAEK